jgi:hypothetical protein
MRGMEGGELTWGFEESSLYVAGEESAGLSNEDIGGRSLVEEDCPGRERFLFAARLFWNQAFTVFVSLNRIE